MFQNAFQSGPAVEVLYSCDKNPTWSLNKANWKFYEKTVKGYVILIDSHNTKLQIPGSDKLTLSLVQPFLVLQIFILPTQPFTLEIAITDISNSKRRIVFSSASKELTVNPMHARVPNCSFVRGTWANISLDLSHCILSCFGNITFRSLDSIVVSSFCKLRRVFTMRGPLMDTTGMDLKVEGVESIPKNLDFPAGVNFVNQLVTPEVIFPLNEVKDVKMTPKKSEARPPLTTAPLDNLKRTGLRTSSVIKKQGNTTTTFFQRNKKGAMSPRAKEKGSVLVIKPEPCSPKEARTGTAASNRYSRGIEEEKVVKEEDFCENPLESAEDEDLENEPEMKANDFLHLTNYRNTEDVMSNNSIEEEIEVDTYPQEIPDYQPEVYITPDHHYFPNKESVDTGPKPTFFTNGLNQATQYRPFTPPFAGLSSMNNVALTEKNQEGNNEEEEDEEEEAELVYDPVLQCYYDPCTMEYYQVNK